MRRVWLGIVGSLLLQMLAPASALAWWGWLDELSGPGHLEGLIFDGRLRCFGTPPPPAGLFERGLSSFDTGTRALELISDRNDGLVQELNRRSAARLAILRWKEWAALAEAITAARAQGYPDAAANLNIPGSVEPRALVQQVVDGFTSLQSELDALADVTSRAGTICQGSRDPACSRNLADAARETSISNRDFAAAAALLPRVLIPIGIRVSLCPPFVDQNRRWSLDVGMRLFHKNAQRASLEEFAGGNELHLLTITPTVNYRLLYNLLRKDNADWIDVGAGAGFYRFTSDHNLDGAIETLTGALLEARIEAHVPPSWRETGGKARKLLYILPSVRLSDVIFPKGFEAFAFGPKLTDPEKAKAIGKFDNVPEVALFWDLGSLLPR